MKKLLSLLSVLTISGTTIPNVIAASYYEKEKNKLENLKRNKRQYGFLVSGPPKKVPKAL